MGVCGDEGRLLGWCLNAWMAKDGSTVVTGRSKRTRKLRNAQSRVGMRKLRDPVHLLLQPFIYPKQDDTTHSTSYSFLGQTSKSP